MGRLKRLLKAVLVITGSYFMVTVLLYKKSYQINNVPESEFLSLKTPQNNRMHNLSNANGDWNPRANPTKVIFLSYSRSGTSFVGELINRNKNGFYYFEPLFGIYSYLYGLPFGFFSQNFFNFPNGSERHSSDYEAKLVSQHLNDLMSCNLDNIPSDFLQTPFLWPLKKEEKFKNYTECLKQVYSANKQEHKHYNTKSNKTKDTISSWFPHSCKHYLSPGCNKLDGKTEYSCFEALFGKKFKKLTTVAQQPETVKHFKLPKSEVYPRLSNNTLTPPNFHMYFKCVKSSQVYSDKCWSTLQNECEEATIVGAKIIRWRMENLAYLLKLDPSIKVVHYLRDPRGTLSSRHEKSKTIDKTIVNQAAKLCSQIKEDIIYRKRLEEIYSRNFYVMKYEDLAHNPITESRKLYRFLEQPMNEDLIKWIYANTQSNVSSTQNQRRLGTSRNNSAATADAWKKKLSNNVKYEVAQTCEETLNLIGYS